VTSFTAGTGYVRYPGVVTGRLARRVRARARNCQRVDDDAGARRRM